MRLVSRTGLAILDQGLFSGANFLAGILLARWLRPEDFGAFSLAFAVSLLFANIHSAVLTEPMLILGSRMEQGRFASYFKQLLGGHTLFMLPSMLGAAATALALAYFQLPSVSSALFGLAAGSFFIHLLPLIRRAFYVRMQLHWPVLGGSVYLVTFLASVVLLHQEGLLSPATGFLSMGLGGLAASLTLFFCLPRTARTDGEATGLRSVAAEHWQYGRWATATVAVAWLPDYVYYAALPAWSGLASAGALRAVMTLLLPLLQAVTAVSILLLPMLVRDRQSGRASMNRRLARFSLVTLAAAAVYVVVLWAFQRPIIAFLYAGKYEALSSGSMLLAGLLSVAAVTTSLLIASLRALERPDLVLVSASAAAATALLPGLLLAHKYGVPGVLAGMALSSTVSTLFLLRSYLNASRQTIPADAGQTSGERAEPCDRRWKVLVSSYACEPDLGSEPEVGWNWARQIGTHCEAWVLTLARHRRGVEKKLAAEPLPHVHFVYVGLPPALQWFQRYKAGEYLCYYVWQFRAWLAARKLHRSVPFDLVHHVSYVNYWTPSFLVFLKVPFVWGPVGGGESTPSALLPICSPKGRRFEIARTAARVIGRLDPFVRCTARGAATIFATSEQTAQNIRHLGGRDIEIWSPVGVPLREIEWLASRPLPSGKPFRLFSAGSLISWKGYELALRAFAAVTHECPGAEYWILGRGPERERLEALVARFGLADRVRFLGVVPRPEMLRLLLEADVLIHPSLHESGGCIVAEALAAGRPVICLDHAGPGIQVTAACGFKIPPRSVSEVIGGMGAAIQRLANDPVLLATMGQAARDRARDHFSWELRGERMLDVYSRVLSNHGVAAAAIPARLQLRPE